MEKSLISVIIPVFNRPVQIKKAVDSVLCQSYKNFECIIINDGSTDETLDVLKEYGKKIKIITTENHGVSAARNTGVKNASGKYLAFLDSDDEWKPKKLEKQLFHLIQGNYRVAQTEEIWIRNGKFLNKTKKHIKPVDDIFIPSLDICMVSPSTVIMEKTLFEDYSGFDETLAVCEDYDLWLRMSFKERFGLLNENLVIKYGGHTDQLSNTPALDKYRIMSLIKILSTHRDLSDFHHSEIIKMLNRKLEIYLAGAKKRGNTEGVDWAEKLLQFH
ncbi:MAG TPA: glycosyltransferase [bacterium]|nr:glycosyltransferase [bacterium]